jgi:hypothetical protein
MKQRATGGRHGPHPRGVADLRRSLMSRKIAGVALARTTVVPAHRGQHHQHGSHLPGLSVFQSQFTAQYNLTMAAALVAIVPVLAVAVTAQGHIIEGITLGALD